MLQFLPQVFHLKVQHFRQRHNQMFLFSLAAGGQAGVERALQNMHDELKRNMLLMGCKNLKELNQSKIIYRK